MLEKQPTYNIHMYMHYTNAAKKTRRRGPNSSNLVVTSTVCPGVRHANIGAIPSRHVVHDSGAQSVLLEKSCCIGGWPLA
jgi:hypothetical protein